MRRTSARQKWPCFAMAAIQPLKSDGTDLQLCQICAKPKKLQHFAAFLVLATQRKLLIHKEIGVVGPE